MARYNKLSIEDINLLKPPSSRLTAIVFAPYVIDRHGHATRKVFAKCICGNIKEIAGKQIANGTTRSCGCLAIDEMHSRAYSIEEINRRIPQDSRLRAVEFAETYFTKGGQRPMRKVKCACDCGNFNVCKVELVLKGHVKSCGCYQIDQLKKRVTKYYPCIPKLLNVYNGMIRRCYKEDIKAYANYGGRGVRVCDEWRNDYQPFLDWSLANGWKPGLQLDKDKLGNGLLYSPSTCCFITSKENNQAEYKRERKNCLWFMFKGKMMLIRDIAKELNISGKTLYSRIFTYKIPFEIAITMKFRQIINKTNQK